MSQSPVTSNVPTANPSAQAQAQAQQDDLLKRKKKAEEAGETDSRDDGAAAELPAGDSPAPAALDASPQLGSTSITPQTGESFWSQFRDPVLIAGLLLSGGIVEAVRREFAKDKKHPTSIGTPTIS